MRLTLNMKGRHGWRDVVKVLQEALEAHVEGLKTAYAEVSVDRTIDDPQMLVDVTRSMNDDIQIANDLLEALGDTARR